MYSLLVWIERCTNKASSICWIRKKRNCELSSNLRAFIQLLTCELSYNFLPASFQTTSYLRAYLRAFNRCHVYYQWHTMHKDSNSSTDPIMTNSHTILSCWADTHKEGWNSVVQTLSSMTAEFMVISCVYVHKDNTLHCVLLKTYQHTWVVIKWDKCLSHGSWVDGIGCYLTVVFWLVQTYRHTHAWPLVTMPTQWCCVSWQEVV